MKTQNKKLADLRKNYPHHNWVYHDWLYYCSRCKSSHFTPAVKCEPSKFKSDATDKRLDYVAGLKNNS